MMQSVGDGHPGPTGLIGLGKLPVAVQVHQETKMKYIGKLSIIGDSGVGKSSLMKQFILGDFSPATTQTIGIDFMTKSSIPVAKDAVLDLRLFDTAGQEAYATIVRVFYRNCHGIVLVFDRSSRKSFTNLKLRWLKEIREYAPLKIPVMLVGNKSDIPDLAVTDDEANAIITDNPDINFVTYISASAKTNFNVDTIFNNIARAVYKVLVSPVMAPTTPVIKLEKFDKTVPEQPKSGWSCGC
jgi:small GTP-binding protein